MNAATFKPDWRVPIQPPDTTGKKPGVVIAMTFVPYGYQIDVYVNGAFHGTECADFAGSHKIPALEAHFADAILDAIRTAKKGL